MKSCFCSLGPSHPDCCINRHRQRISEVMGAPKCDRCDGYHHTEHHDEAVASEQENDVMLIQAIKNMGKRLEKDCTGPAWRKYLAEMPDDGECGAGILHWEAPSQKPQGFIEPEYLT